MSGLDDLKKLVDICNTEIKLREGSIKDEALYGPNLKPKNVDYCSQQEYEDTLAEAFNQYATIFNTIRAEHYNLDITDKDSEVNPDTSAFMEYMAIEIKDQANLQPFLEYANSLQTEEECQMNHDARVAGAFAITKFFDRCLEETAKYEYRDTVTYGIHSDGASIAADVHQRLLEYSALQLRNER